MGLMVRLRSRVVEMWSCFSLSSTCQANSSHFNLSPRPPLQSIGEGERMCRRRRFARKMMPSPDLSNLFSDESPFPIAMGRVDTDLREGPGLGLARSVAE